MSGAHPDLAALLRGELSNASALDAADHVRDCAACRSDLLEVSVGHGLLTSAHRTTSAASGSGPAPMAHEVMPARLRREVRRSRWRRPAMAAAVAVLVAGALGVGAALLGQESAPGPSRPTPVAETTASLEPVDPQAGVQTPVGGRVSMTTDQQLVTRMRVDTVELPRAARGEFYYVWLLDPRTNKMLPLGQVTPGRPARFDLPESLVEAYSAIDISLEADDGDPGHSVTSVLRASYAAPS